MIRQRVLGLLGAMTLVFSLGAQADVFHYKDMLIGERAAGLGGAYIGISDDPSGIYYNPAGIVFSMENYISGSANGYQVTKKVHKNVWSGKNYTYESSSLIPAFFGFTQSLSRKDKMGFAIVVTNSDLLDQEDVIRGISSVAGEDKNLRRRFFLKDVTYLFGPAYAREISKNFTVGLTLFGFARTEKIIDNQYLELNASAGQPDYFLLNRSITRSAYGLMPKLGVQWMPTQKISLGATVTKPFTLTGSGHIEQTKSEICTSDTCSTSEVETDKEAKYAIPEPLSFGFGGAYFFSKKFLITSDFDLHMPEESYHEYEVKMTYNWSVGLEWYPSQNWAWRTGVFSNNANTAKLADGMGQQTEHVDMLGLSTAISMYGSGSSLTIGTSFGYGSGKGDAKTESGGTAAQLTNDLEMMSLTFYLMGSYQL